MAADLSGSERPGRVHGGHDDVGGVSIDERDDLDVRSYRGRLQESTGVIDHCESGLVARRPHARSMPKYRARSNVGISTSSPVGDSPVMTLALAACHGGHRAGGAPVGQVPRCSPLPSWAPYGRHVGLVPTPSGIVRQTDCGQQRGSGDADQATSPDHGSRPPTFSNETVRGGPPDAEQPRSGQQIDRRRQGFCADSFLHRYIPSVRRYRASWLTACQRSATLRGSCRVASVWLCRTASRAASLSRRRASSPCDAGSSLSSSGT